MITTITIPEGKRQRAIAVLVCFYVLVGERDLQTASARYGTTRETVADISIRPNSNLEELLGLVRTTIRWQARFEAFGGHYAGYHRNGCRC
jgi:hypothetical protein